MNRDKTIVADAREIEAGEIVLLNISNRFLPLTKSTICKALTANVLVLIPPPVEFGEAPIHMSRKEKNTIGTPIFAISRVLNPAVLEVTE